jgi:TetR/AcrR family transcriptional regulator, fatty acid metabolism regulator protein
MPTKEELKNRRETQITRAAYEIIARDGYENITVQDIADHAGFSKGIVYYYFRSKDDVMVSLFDSTIAVLDRRFADVRRESPDPRQQLESVISISLDIVNEHIEFYRVIMVFWTQIHHKQLMRQVNAKLFSHWRREIEKILEQGMTRGVFKQGLAPRLVASSIIAKVLGVSLQYIFDPNAFDLKVMREQVIAEVIAVI